jgi:integrase
MATFQRIEKNLYIREGRYYSLRRVGGKQRWRSLRTTDIDVARRALAAPSDVQSEIAAVKAMLSQLLASSAAPSKTKPQVSATLRELFDQYLDSNVWASDETRHMYWSRSNKLVKFASNSWAKFVDFGPFELWKKVEGSNLLKNHVAALLKGFSQWANDQGLFADYVSWQKDLARMKHLRSGKRVIDQLPSPEQMDQFLAQVRMQDLQSGQLCGLLAYTGIRISGALTLNWQQVDSDLRWIRVVEKGSKSRVVPIGKHAQDILAERKSVISKGLVFRFSQTQLSKLRRVMHQAAKLHGSPVRTPHFLRHWFTSQALIQGANVRTLAGILGHSDGGALLLKTYGHLCAKDAQDLMTGLKF